MSDLVEWLRANLDEDERAAISERAEMEALELRRDPSHVPLVWIPPLSQLGYPGDPARVLAEVEAKRQLIDLLVDSMEGDYAPWNEDALLLLAAPFKHRPGWRDEWAVTHGEG